MLATQVRVLSPCDPAPGAIAVSRLPPYAEGLFALLRGGSVQLDDAGWRSLLQFADKTQCTLFLRGSVPSAPSRDRKGAGPGVLQQAPGLPDWLEEEIEARRARNAERRQRVLAAYEEAAGALTSRGLEFLLLK